MPTCYTPPCSLSHHIPALPTCHPLHAHSVIPPLYTHPAGGRLLRHRRLRRLLHLLPDGGGERKRGQLRAAQAGRQGAAAGRGRQWGCAVATACLRTRVLRCSRCRRAPLLGAPAHCTVHPADAPSPVPPPSPSRAHRLTHCCTHTPPPGGALRPGVWAPRLHPLPRLPLPPLTGRVAPLLPPRTQPGRCAERRQCAWRPGPEAEGVGSGAQAVATRSAAPPAPAFAAGGCA